MAESIEQFGFELTANALAEQERALTGLRARAGTVLAAASIAGSFFGAKTSHGSLGVSGVLAMIAFALCVGSAVCHPMDARPHRLTWFHGGQASTERYSRRPAQTPAAGTAPGHGPPGFALPEKRGGLLGGKGS